MRSVSGRLAARVIWQGPDGTVALTSRRGIASRYFALRHPVPARHIVRRFQKRASRIAGLSKFELLGVVGRSHALDGGEVPWWGDAAADALGCDLVDWLLLSGPDTSDKSIGFLFAQDSEFPIAVAKTAKSSAGVARVERGYRALERLRKAGVTGRGLAPEPLAFLNGPNGEIASIETAVRGTWLDGVLRRSNEAHYIEKITDWLIDLGRATRGSAEGDSWSLLFRDVVEQFRENVAGRVDAGFVEAACKTIADVREMPTVFEHHDCAPWNFYLTPDRRAVAFDWDNANPRGVPAFDLVQMLGQLGFSVDGCRGSRLFAQSLRRREAGKLGAVRRECRARYAFALGIDDAVLRAIQVFAWMRLANDEFHERRRAGIELRREEVDRSILGLWLEEARSAIDR